MSTSERDIVRSGSISTSWILYDFGKREGAADEARELLVAAQANQASVLQSLFATVAKDYYTAQAAQGSFLASQNVENSARQSVDVAEGRVQRGIAPISDQYQAQTAYAEAVFARTKAQGDLDVALGTLCSDIAVDPDTALVLSEVGTTLAPDDQFHESLRDLIEAARRDNPDVQYAEAQYRASRARVTETQADGSPSISLVNKYTRDNQPASIGLGLPTYPATGHDYYFGVQLSIPLFEGFGRHYQVAQAEAQSELQLDAVHGARQTVALGVWSSYHLMNAVAENLSNSETFADIARRSLDAARSRYLSGVGNMLELLNAQAAVANAEKQRIQCISEWKKARLQLAAALGRIGMWSIR